MEYIATISALPVCVALYFDTFSLVHWYKQTLIELRWHLDLCDIVKRKITKTYLQNKEFTLHSQQVNKL